jgi:zinc ribbon protein
MAQQPTQFCPECGMPSPKDQRFCSNCGSAIKVSSSDPTVAASSLQTSAPTVVAPGPFAPMGATIPNAGQANTGADPYLTRDDHHTPPPPPPSASTYNPYTVNAPGGPQVYEQNASKPPASYNAPVAPMPGMYNPVPPYAQARKSHGCLITSIVLLLILVAGIGGFLALKSRFFPAQANNGTGTPGISRTTTTGGSANGTPTPSGISTDPLNLKVTFANIQTTIVSAQSSSNFSDDSSTTGSAGVVRLNLHEVNSSPANPDYIESDVLLLVLPDGSTVQSTNQLHNISPDAGVTRDNWADFPLSRSISLDQLTLRMGTPSQHQMDVSLKANANISKYQDKTSNLNTQFQYNGLNWTLKDATLSYSYGDKQATTGNLYVVVKLAVINPTSSNAAIFPNDIMRMQAGSSTQAPDSYDFPYSVPIQGTGGGVVGFLVPQDATSFTLILLGDTNANPPVAQVTQTFQIQ